MKEESNYPKSPFIKLFDEKKSFNYKIIKEGTYPPAEQLCYTQNPKHPIPHGYIVETQHTKKHIVECSIEYVEVKPLFRIRFGTNFSREVYSLETSTDAACKYYQVYLFLLLSIEKERKIRPLEINSRIRPFNELNYFTKRRKMLSLSQHILDIVEAEKENKFHPTDQIELNQIKFKTCNGLYEINFGQLDKMKERKKIEAVVKSLDKGHISREAYRSLARIEPNIPREGAVSDARQRINSEMKKVISLTLVNLSQPTVFDPITEEPDITNNIIITNMLESIGKEGQRRVTDILNYIVPSYIKQGILIPEVSTLHIQISGDGRNVGRKVKHVMIVMTLLNNLSGLQKLENYYTLVLYLGAETYESLKNVLVPLISDLCNLKKNGFNQIDGNHWPVELYFSSDWKFLAICLGIKAANAQYFCPWCDCRKDEINTKSKIINKSMDNIKKNYNQTNGHVKEPLFHMIPLKNWVCDEDEEIWKIKILSEMQRLKISFYFWREKTNNNLSYTLLMGPDKLKILKEFDLSAVFQSKTRAEQIRALWNQFYKLYLLMQDKTTTKETFCHESQAWLDEFLAPSTGHLNKNNFVR
ncbi:hypothetical protein GLOIN_2v1474533 [Rhizophagus irregularis DAOM 181602=DAOM 197198]|nr:hypothetical protein GLOIN_2v1474533 [Rhizophagus irregularis DAOM 181602=DAOM 197198]